MKLKVLTFLTLLALALFSFSSHSFAGWGFLKEAVAYCSGGGTGIECIEGNDWCEEFNCW
jgi:hypothetical protein